MANPEAREGSSRLALVERHMWHVRGDTAQGMPLSVFFHLLKNQTGNE